MRAIAAMLLLGACAGPEPAPAVPLGVYAEFLSDAEVEPHLPALAARGAALSIAVPDARIGDAGLAALLRAAEGAGVEVRIWLVLDRAMGYWPNQANVAEYDDAVARLLAWLATDGLTASAVVFDLEPAYAYSEELRASFSSLDLSAITTLLRSHVDAGAYGVARDALAATVARVQAAGLRAECVTYPQVVDDLEDGDDELQDALDIPVRGVPFDEVAFMVYQTGFAEAAGGDWLGPGLVRSYATDAREHLGDRATIALGTIGTAGIFEPTGPVYEDPEVLRADVAAAVGQGIVRIEVYSLDGMLGLGGTARWLDATRTAGETPVIDATVRLARSLAATLDDGRLSE